MIQLLNFSGHKHNKSRTNPQSFIKNGVENCAVWKMNCIMHVWVLAAWRNYYYLVNNKTE